MRKRAIWMLAAAVVLLVMRTGIDSGTAKVVRDTGATVGNPGVETGGQSLPPQPPPPIPYSLIGALASEDNWLMQCAFWPWREFGSMRWFRHHALQEERRLTRRISRSER